jgi:endoglucanase
MRAQLNSLAALCGLLASACLTTPASETGLSKKARTIVPRACGEDALVEDMEDGDTRILVRQGRGGYWFTSVDPEGSTIEPSGNFKMASPGRDGSKHAARMQGTMAEAGWSVYALMAFNIADPTGPYDASRYTGISFWAKGPGHIRFKVPDLYTVPGGGFCKDCYNDFGVELALTSEWERYTIPFEWLSQQAGWGDPRPEVSREALYGMQWQFGSRGRTYDVWVDDVSFVCGTEDGER